MTPARQQLIADLVAAPCGSPELDARIAIQRGWMKIEHSERRYIDAAGSVDIEPHRVEWVSSSGRHTGCALPTPWTTSIDAAMTLIPGGYYYTLTSSPYTRRLGCKLRTRERHYDLVEAFTQPLAICAAAMKIGG